MFEAQATRIKHKSVESLGYLNRPCVFSFIYFLSGNKGYY